MNLKELYDRVVAAGVMEDSQIANMKTSVKQYAKLLGYDDPAKCDEEVFNKWSNKKRNAFIAEGLNGTASIHKKRNLKNNISRLIREARALSLFKPNGVTEKIEPQREKSDFRSKPLRKGYTHTTQYRYKMAMWNSELTQDYVNYDKWNNTPGRRKGRLRRTERRPITNERYLRCLEFYCGYLVNIEDVELGKSRFDANNLRFEDFFIYKNIEGFIDWHIKRHGRVSSLVMHILTVLGVIAKSYRGDKDLYERLRELKAELDKPEVVYEKEEVWTSLKKLDEVGEKEIEKARKMSNGVRKALTFERGLITKLWVRRPFRQRNIREMKLEKNLTRDGGKWITVFKGKENKIAFKKGKENVFILEFPRELVPLLEEFLSDYRPLLAGIQNDSYSNVVLNQRGKPYTVIALNKEIKRMMWAYLGIAVHPHLIRTIWATEFIKRTKDIATAAKMLNDTEETVWKHYHHLLDADAVKEADKFISDILHNKIHDDDPDEK